MRIWPIIAIVACSVVAVARGELTRTLTENEWSDIRTAHEKHFHRAMASDDGYIARNPRQRWLTRFDREGFVVKPDDGNWTWGLKLRSYGFVGHKRMVDRHP